MSSQSPASSSSPGASTSTPKASLALSYLDLPEDYVPSPETQPIEFLTKHFRELPPHLLSHFSATTAPKQRSLIPAIRNRRLQYVDSDPSELSLASAKATWPTLWPGREPPGREQGEDEREWAEKFFMGSSLKPHVGKLGMLLGGYEEERSAEHVRAQRRAAADEWDRVPEEEESDEEEGDETQPPPEGDESAEDVKAWFLRRVRERFIYGLLESVDYDKVDWDESWDADNDRSAQEAWFDEEEESDETPPDMAAELARIAAALPDIPRKRVQTSNNTVPIVGAET
ncbi:uncharacterized protein C8Q71DRAFT_731475 [Rhodofomes roseus]|uniref:CCD97-like C-terminal domain-containing protein n=1 Tax=Rhodofomes roseus TaxID=34475 RepID=A0ABQ8KYQ4_9APHY|nr:uncharacterized protein C8Q71DRAFT_731475 [Rhodofomes roseus]KAH9844148.1 hypothetical protein C8Q71DRAFT_731475 [Rhodofomes roseus]